MGLQNGNRQINTALFDLILLRSEHSLFPNICFLNFEISNTHNRHFINHVPIVYHFPPTHRNIWQCIPPQEMMMANLDNVFRLILYTCASLRTLLYVQAT